MAADPLDSPESLNFFRNYYEYVQKHQDIFRRFLVNRPNMRFLAKWQRSTKDHLRSRARKLNVSHPEEEVILSVLANDTVTIIIYLLKKPGEIDEPAFRSLIFQYMKFWENNLN
ncbi:MAG: hypothetical protein ACI4IA_03220 [Acutalibacteraceae bacterium]